jgi:hypothetical protein
MRHLLYGLVLGLLTAAMSLVAQSAQGSLAFSQIPAGPGSAPRSPTPTIQPKPSPVPPAQGAAASVTVEGCVVREQDVPGRTVNPIERAGVADDFILIDAKVTRGATPPEAKKTMFEIEGIAHETLRAHVGKRVQLLGSFGAIDSGLVEITASELKAIDGNCREPR